MSFVPQVQREIFSLAMERSFLIKNLEDGYRINYLAVLKDYLLGLIVAIYSSNLSLLWNWINQKYFSCSHKIIFCYFSSLVLLCIQQLFFVCILIQNIRSIQIYSKYISLIFSVSVMTNVIFIYSTT